MFWHQLLHWLVSDTRGQLSAQVSAGILQDDGHVQLLADVRDRNYLPATDAIVNAHVIGPDRLQADVSPAGRCPDMPGRYQADWTAPAVGMYVADITANQGALERRSRHHRLPAPGWGRGEFPHRPERRLAEVARRGYGRAVLVAG